MLDWEQVYEHLEELTGHPALWRAGQDASLQWMRERLASEPGVLIADEVGLGKTRLAIALATCVAHCGGSVAIVIPPGLTFQWRDEELAGFLRQASAQGVSWLQHWWPGGAVLRTFNDLFTTGQRFPVSNQAPITFISHNFGLPRTGTAKRAELWALPFMLKKELVDGRKVKGARSLKISGFQADAVQWLAKEGSKSSHQRLNTELLGKASPSAFSKEPSRKLFEDLVGQLVGQFDLVIIDEAHKSRAGNDATKKEKASETLRKSRLSRLLDNIVFRHGAKRTRAAKRIALTATPMEMQASQWVTIFRRIGLDDQRVADLERVVTFFENATRGLRVGSEAELHTLRDAAGQFQEQLKPLITRRLWRDDPMVQRYAAANGSARAAHPHRRLVPNVAPIATLSSRDRRYLAMTEALSASARGADTALNVKTTGSRFSQALPILAENPESVKEGIRPVGAQAKRIEYWEQRLRDLDQDHADLVFHKPWSLQWHPRVRHAINLIEGLAGNGKVLVFGEFVQSLRALERALNIRHYLRHLGKGQALPLPRNVNHGDADFQRWLADPEFNLDETARSGIAARAEALAAQYESDRSHLRDLCREAVLAHCGHEALPPDTEKTLTTWLVQQLCVQDQLWSVEDEQGAETLRIHATGLLRSIRDPDPADELQDEPGISVATRWTQIVEQLETDLQRDAKGFVFRMSPYAQLLIGDVKAATRRARQGTFNNAQLNPRILIGQSDVMSEGLNLHRACRTVVLFHLDWNPGRIEQQIGRVDRQDSDWMNACGVALDDDETAPTLDVHTVAMEGTYDDLRTRVVEARAKVLRAQLFGEIVAADLLATMSVQAQSAIGQINIDFRPPLRSTAA